MIIQGPNESRTKYLLRVAAEYVEIFPEYTIEYDETECDGYCLAEELRSEAEMIS